MDKYKLAIADSGGEYETEYDGRTMTMCLFCSSCLDGNSHDDNCIVVEARNSEEYKRLLEERNQEEEQKNNTVEFWSREKLNCKFCGKKVAACGMKSHLKMNKLCLEQQEA